MNTRKLCAVVGLMAVVVIGCNRGPTYVTGTVNGKLTVKGQPVAAGTTVQFTGGQGGGSGTTGPDGSFTMMGVRVGKYQIAVLPAPTTPAADMKDPKAAMQASLQAGSEGRDLSKEVKNDVPIKYKRPETSGVEFEVKKGPNEFKLDMTE